MDGTRKKATYGAVADKTRVLFRRFFRLVLIDCPGHGVIVVVVVVVLLRFPFRTRSEFGIHGARQRRHGTATRSPIFIYAGLGDRPFVAASFPLARVFAFRTVRPRLRWSFSKTRTGRVLFGPSVSALDHRSVETPTGLNTHTHIRMLHSPMCM